MSETQDQIEEKRRQDAAALDAEIKRRAAEKQQASDDEWRH